MQWAEPSPERAGTPLAASRVGWAAAAALLAVLWFGTLGVRGLFAPDEGRYALIPREMLLSGDWVTPHLNGLVYLEKPPLQYWATATFYALLGEHEWTARLWSALCGFATLALAGFFAGSRRGPAAAAAAVSVLASCPLFFLFSQVNTLDMGLTFFLTVALFSFVAALRTDRGRAWAATAWLAIALGVLSKGLVAVVLPVLTVVLYAAIARDGTFVRRMHPMMGALVVVAIAGPWFIMAQLQHEQFFDFFVIHEHFARYSTEVHRRTGAWWYFIAVMVLGTLPWTPFCSGLVKRPLLGRAARGAVNEKGLLLLWIAVFVVFFSFSDSKLPAYVLPAFPPLAVLTAFAIQDQTLGRLAGSAWAAGLLGIALAAAAVLLVPRGVDDVPGGAATAFLPWAGAAAALLIAGSTASVLQFRKGRRSRAIITLAAATLVAWQLIITGSITFERSYSAREFAREVLANLGSHASAGDWYSVGTYDNSFAFYVKRSFTVVAYEDELKLGLSIDPARGIANLNEFVTRWTQGGQSFAVMQPRVYDTLLARGLPMSVVARDARHVFVSRLPLGTHAGNGQRSSMRGLTGLATRELTGLATRELTGLAIIASPRDSGAA